MRTRKMNLEYQTIESICIEINIDNRKWLGTAYLLYLMLIVPLSDKIYTLDC
jgi:hypothetical protein